jgi:excisionase family DNA binding protein
MLKQPKAADVLDLIRKEFGERMAAQIQTALTRKAPLPEEEPPRKKLRSVSYVAQALDRSLPTVYAAIHRGEIPVVKVGRIIKVSDDTLQELLKERRLTESAE